MCPVIKKVKPAIEPISASYGNPHEPIACPNDDYWLEITEFATYIHHDGALADYEKLECRQCGYVRHVYYPIKPVPVSSPDDIPF